MTTRISTITFLMSFDNCLRFPAMMKISTFGPNIADDRFILKIEGLKISGKQTSYRTSSFAERERHKGLVRLVRSDRKTPLKDVTTRFNENRETQVSKRTVQRSLYYLLLLYNKTPESLYFH
jgi:hypothetical protein